MTKAPFLVPKPAGVPETIERLTAAFSAVPGVGEKTARRYALWFATADLGGQGPAAVLAQVLTVMRQSVHLCPRCNGITDAARDGICAICADPKRDASILCIVATVNHLLAIERSGAFRGRYLVLGKLISPLEGVEAIDMPLDDLVSLISPGMEVLLALPVTVEGDATALLIHRELDGVGVRVTRLAAGIPHNGDMEHADQVTISRAIAERKAIT